VDDMAQAVVFTLQNELRIAYNVRTGKIDNQTISRNHSKNNRAPRKSFGMTQNRMVPRK
jgi:hypothetical protein